MIASGVRSMKNRKDRPVIDSPLSSIKEISHESLSRLKIIKIESSTCSRSPNESFSKNPKRVSLSPKSSSLSSSPSSSPQPSTKITSIQVSPDHHRSQCYITTYTPYRDLLRTNVIKMGTPIVNSKSPSTDEPATSTSSSPPIIEMVSSSLVSAKTTRSGRLATKKSGRWTFTNCRERQRQQNVNEAFQELRSKIPTQPVDKKLSKCSILTRAIEYIKILNGILERMDEGSDSARKRPRYDADDADQSTRNPCSRNSVLTCSSSSSFHDYESDGGEEFEETLEDEDCPVEDDDEEEKNTSDLKDHDHRRNVSSTSSSSRIATNVRPLETNVSITRVSTTVQGSQNFNQITDRVMLNCSPMTNPRSSSCRPHQRSFCHKENLCDGLSQDSQETQRSSPEDKVIMDDFSLVSYEFDSSREQSISSTVSSPSDSD